MRGQVVSRFAPAATSRNAMHKFLCGCDLPTVDRLIGDPELISLATVVYDPEGFIVCMAHHQRRYGWRSLPISDMIFGRRGQWQFAHWTELEIERFVLFGEWPSKPVVKLHMIEDRRDNRDPEALGRSYLASLGGN